MKKCPKCGHELGDRWCAGRRLQYYCEMCAWEDTPRIPEQLAVKSTKEVMVTAFSGWDFILYDKYGHIRTISKSYQYRADALLDLRKALSLGSGPNSVDGPYTGVLFYTPPRMEIQGEVFKK